MFASGLVIQIIPPKVLHEMYHHTATETLYHLCGARISWTSTLAECLINLA